MRRKRIAAAAAVLIALGLAAGTAATTPPVGFILSFLLLTSQGQDPGDLTHSATKVSLLNLGTQTCAYTVRFLDKSGVQQCQLADTLAPGKQTNFSTDDVPDDVYQSGNNCSPGLDNYKGSVEVFVPNTPSCRQRTVVDGFRAHWETASNACQGMCATMGNACTDPSDCEIPNVCEEGTCAIGGDACEGDGDCPSAFESCVYTCEKTGGMCMTELDCPEVGEPETADPMTILSIDKYVLKLQEGD